MQSNLLCLLELYHKLIINLFKKKINFIYPTKKILKNNLWILMIVIFFNCIFIVELAGQTIFNTYYKISNIYNI